MMCETMLTAVSILSGAIVSAEALNKLERLDIFGFKSTKDAKAWRVGLALLMPWREPPGTLARMVQFAAWFACALGAAGAVILPLMNKTPTSSPDVLTLSGFAALILHARYMEWQRFKASAAA